jgi:hypothetical protein
MESAMTTRLGQSKRHGASMMKLTEFERPK